MTCSSTKPPETPEAPPECMMCTVGPSAQETANDLDMEPVAIAFAIGYVTGLISSLRNRTPAGVYAHITEHTCPAHGAFLALLLSNVVGKMVTKDPEKTETK